MPPGHAGCPFHSHALADELFYSLSCRGVFRYGDQVCEVGPGDCLCCPAGTGVAHQLANPFDEDLVYLGAGANHPHEVCLHPDSGKTLVRSLHRVGYLHEAPHMDGEPERPKIFELLK
ncbi:cupin domain-containing protein [Chromobacterium subtsugae]|uniref:cupin domain-containing protein n=1 Tax=Chromobacterium subtsugae TaxID=251747 RepID=UPI0021008F7E|nr:MULTISPECIES: cupin domain-containing protein [Chromobacterium]WSE93898.1 cupin domain-containing protein [Chromobacterium subtsugae]WVH62276.1 cupin domain-containing protein [Chromobacterium subtsugae]